MRRRRGKSKQGCTVKEQDLTIGLFPLSSHILPGGKMDLRLFEPRYIDMVKEACVNGTGFGICMFNSQGEKASNQHIHPVGTYVTISDFERLDDGLLGITVEAQRCFNILQIKTLPNQLRVGTVEWLDNWQHSDLDLANFEIIGNRLKEIFVNYPEVKKRYQKLAFDDPVWVSYRWLELLPVQAEQKQQLLMQKEVGRALDFLAQFVK